MTSPSMLVFIILIVIIIIRGIGKEKIGAKHGLQGIYENAFSAKAITAGISEKINHSRSTPSLIGGAFTFESRIIQTVDLLSH